MTRRGPNTLNRLNAFAISRLKAPGWYTDGGGLYLEVTPTGTKRWTLRLRVGGNRRRDFGLGSLTKVSLQNARERAAEYRARVYAGLDPTARDETAENTPTFEVVVCEVHRARKGQWSNGKHIDQWLNTLRDYAFPILGHKPVGIVTAADVLEVLKPIWTTKPETARRVRQRLRMVFEWARAAGHRTGDNPVDLVATALPRQAPNITHHEALPYVHVPKFYADLARGPAAEVTKLAFAFLILTAARTKEVRLADVPEFDEGVAQWTIPALRMKARRQHVVPLSSPALRIIKKARAALPKGHKGLLFPDAETGDPLSENRFLNAREDIGYKHRCTPHGFRSSFRDWVSEETSFSPEVAEMALAHTIKNKVEAAYRRGELLKKRKQLMDAWAAFVTANV